MKLSKIYSSEVSDFEGEWIEPIVPKSKLVERRRKVNLRTIVNAIFYRADNDVKWRNLPGDFRDW